VQEYDVVVVEDLALKGMAGALRLGKSVMDLGYGEFVRKLRYKALWNDKTVIVADRWYASSKMCHVCGWEKKDLSLREREWECAECGARHGHDKNGAMNLAGLGEEIPVRCGELTSADMGALAFGEGSETAVGNPGMGRSRNLGEQVEQSTQASSPRL
jgi:putative transposase